MNTLAINKNDFKNCQIEIDATNLPNNFKSCQIEIDATHLANILLQCNIDIQREFLNHFLYKLSNKQINQLSICVGLGQAYDNLETLYKLANAELPKLVAKWEEEKLRREKEWERAMDLYGTPDGRPNR